MFSPDGTLISASAALHCGGGGGEIQTETERDRDRQRQTDRERENAQNQKIIVEKKKKIMLTDKRNLFLREVACISVEGVVPAVIDDVWVSNPCLTEQ